MIQYETEGHAEFVKTLFPPGYKGVCIDIGAHDPIWINNTWIFEQVGWDAYCIEPNPSCLPRLREFRKNVIPYAVGAENKDGVDFYVYSVSNAYAGPFHEASETGLYLKEDMKDWPTTKIQVNMRTFEWLMENEIKQDHIDYISIDVEGAEMDVLSTLDVEKYNPRIVVIENKAELAQHEWFSSRGYKKIRRIHLNDIYERDVQHG